MNILYGIQGTGNGHLCRSKEVIQALKNRGHEVKVIISGRGTCSVTDFEDLTPFDHFKGLTFSVSNGTIHYTNTLKKLSPIQFLKDLRKIPLVKTDLIISDFEPLTSWAARLHGKECIGIGHQYAFLYPFHSIKLNPASKLLTKYFAPVDVPIGLHWDSFGYPILPPIIPAYLKTRSTLYNKILVYLPFENLDDIKMLFSKFTSYEFYIYGGIQTCLDRGNIHLRAFSRKYFLEDLKECSGIVSNAGFELPSEALHLGKKILVKPLHGQFEQESNAIYLKRSGFGSVMNKLDSQIVNHWLSLPFPKPKNYPPVADYLAEWLTAEKRCSLIELSRKCWKFL